MRDFKKYTIWQMGMNLVKRVYSFSNTLPNSELFGITGQIRRASVSIPSNIAEGCSRSGDLEFKRFLEIAHGSSFELETQLILIKEIYNKDNSAPDEIITDLKEIPKGLSGLISKIKKESSRV